jgi:hypothetical protein
MFDAYAVSVKLALDNKISAGLIAISSQLKHVDGDLKSSTASAALLEKRLGALKTAGMVGAGLAGAGMGMLSLFKVPLEQAMEWEKISASMRQKGLGDAQIADAQKFVTANKIYGTSIMDRAKIFNEAQGSFRESGKSGPEALEAAKFMTPVLASYQLAMSTLTDTSHAAAEGSFSQLNKIVELMGGLGNTARANEIVGGVFKAVQSSGKMVSERDLRQFITMGGSAVSGLPMDKIFGALEPIIGEFGGSSVGTGMNTAYRLLNGTQSRPSRLFVREALKMGLWDKNALTFNSQGGVKEYKGHPLKEGASTLMRTDTTGFAEMLMATYKSNGITSQADRERENDILLGRTGAKIYNKIMLQLEVLERSQEAYAKSQSPDQVNKSQAESPMQKMIVMQKAWDDAMLKLGKTVMPLATKAVIGLTSVITSFVNFAEAHPTAFKFMIGMFVALGAVLVVAGTLAVLGAALGGIALVLGGTVGAGIIAVGAGIGVALVAIGVAVWAFWDDIKALWTKFTNLFHSGNPSSMPNSTYAVEDPDGYYAKKEKAAKNKSVMDDYVPSANQKPIQVTSVLNVDGKKMAEATSKHTAQAIARAVNSTQFDPRMTMPTPALNR